MLRIQMREFTLYIDWVFFNVSLPPVLSSAGLKEPLLQSNFLLDTILFWTLLCIITQYIKMAKILEKL